MEAFQDQKFIVYMVTIFSNLWRSSSLRNFDIIKLYSRSGRIQTYERVEETLFASVRLLMSPRGPRVLGIWWPKELLWIKVMEVQRGARSRMECETVRPWILEFHKKMWTSHVTLAQVWACNWNEAWWGRQEGKKTPAMLKEVFQRPKTGNDTEIDKSGSVSTLDDSSRWNETNTILLMQTMFLGLIFHLWHTWISLPIWWENLNMPPK